MKSGVGKYYYYDCGGRRSRSDCFCNNRTRGILDYGIIDFTGLATLSPDLFPKNIGATPLQ